MGLSKHPDNNDSLWKELQLLDESPVLLSGKLVKPSGCFRLSGSPPQVIYNTNCPDDLKKKVEDIVMKYRSSAHNISYFYTVAFDFENIHYTGRFTPEFKKDQEHPSSWHIVLNEVFFGYLHKNHGHWENTEQRPAGLTSKAGELIDAGVFQPQTVEE